MIKWVARLAFVTVLLALIGTSAIIMNMPARQENKNGERQKQAQPLADTPLNFLEATPESTLQSIDITDSETPIDTLDKNELQKQFSRKPPQQDTIASDVKVEPSEIRLNNNIGRSDAPKVEIKETLLNSQELLKILSKIYVTRVTNNIKANCVHLFITEKSKKKRTLNQIERYLTRKHYVIAGRAVTTREVKGIKILAAKNCVSLVIGTF